MKTKCLLLICFLMAGITCGGSPDDGIMPEGFEQIHIGMDWRSVVLSRPNAEILNMMPKPGTNLKPDPEKPSNRGLSEKLTGVSFDWILYSFENGILNAVSFIKKHSSSSVGKSEELIRKVVRIRGQPTRIEILTAPLRRGVLIHGVLTWQDDALHINVMVPMDYTAPVKDEEHTIGLQIMKRTYAEQIKAIGTLGYTRTGKESQGEDKERLEAFKSRIQKLLSASKN
ncbi:MAG: hypothetical protein WCV00_22045 [Verrucomicrobiia bacterium]|jgi:hypothetical protein